MQKNPWPQLSKQRCQASAKKRGRCGKPRGISFPQVYCAKMLLGRATAFNPGLLVGHVMLLDAVVDGLWSNPVGFTLNDWV